MADEGDGLKIARQRIAQEAAERTGFLDLGRLGLTCLPEELFDLSHLRRLNLGSGMTDEEGEWQEAAEDISLNDIQSDLGELARLAEPLRPLLVRSPTKLSCGHRPAADPCDRLIAPIPRSAT